MTGKETAVKAFFLRHKKLHIWLLAELCLLAAFFLTRGRRAWMNALAGRVTTPLRRALGALCSRVRFSVAEALCVLLVIFVLVYVIAAVIAVIRGKGRRGRRLYGAVLGAACVALTIYGGFCFLWGVDYYTDSFQDRSGIRAEAVSAEDLGSVTAYFAARLSDTADSLSFSTPLSASWATKGDSIYRALLYYNKVDAGAQPITISRVPVLQIQTTTRPDTLKTDPVAFESIWMSSNRKYLNLSLSIKTGKSDGQLVAQSIGLFRKETTAGHALYLQLNHNQNGVPEYYSSHVYLSIPMSRISAGTILHLILNSYDGIIEREVTL